MHVGLIASGNKYTGAAAVAEHRCRALAVAGVDTRLLYVAGNNLQDRLRSEPWAVPGLRKERAPAHLFANLRAVRELSQWADVLVCHLPHDHFLCRLARAHRTALVVRSFSNPSHLSRDPYHRWLVAPISAALTANSAMLPAARRLCGAGRPLRAAPVPLEDRFHPGVDGRGHRDALGIPPGAPVLGMVGKVAPGRGFETLLETAARLDETWRVLIVGHGEARAILEAKAWRLRMNDRVHWAGYQESSLPDLFATMDVVLFPAPGSDHGHRVVSEAQGCARAVVAFDVPGVEDLIAEGRTGRIVAHADAAADVAHELVSRPRYAAQLGKAAADDVTERRFEAEGNRLADFLRTLM